MKALTACLLLMTPWPVFAGDTPENPSQTVVPAPGGETPPTSPRELDDGHPGRQYSRPARPYVTKKNASAEATPEDKKKTWWEKREERKPDIYFPHNVHMDIMKQEGDMCMLCHSYQPTPETDPEKLRAMTEVLNEPLKAVCHDCHVVERRAPWRCDVCHPDKTKIWPEDHKFGYIQHHAETARRDERACRECHLELSFCTDCHFRREISGIGYHPLGYITLHGMEARTMPSNCGRCHNNFYCDDCHRRRR